MSPDHSNRNLLIIAALLQLIWGLVPSASRLVINEIPIELYIAIRWTISGLIFAGYLFMSGKWKMPSFADFIKVSALGIGGFALASIGMLYGLKLGGVSNFALTCAMSPMITSTLAIFFLKEKPQRLFYLALPVSILGLTFLVMGKHEIFSLQIALTATIFILSGCFLEALVFVFSKRFGSKLSAFEYLAIGQLAAAAFMWGLQISVFHQTSSLSQLTIQGMCAALFVSVVACVLCYSVLYWLLKRLDGHRLALFDGLHALSGTLFGVMLFHEQMNGFIIFGGLLLLAGLVLGNLPASRKIAAETLIVD